MCSMQGRKIGNDFSWGDYNAVTMLGPMCDVSVVQFFRQMSLYTGEKGRKTDNGDMDKVLGFPIG